MRKKPLLKDSNHKPRYNDPNSLIMAFKHIVEKPEIDAFMASFVKFLELNFQGTQGSSIFCGRDYQFLSDMEFSKLRELYQGSSGFHSILLGMILEACHEAEKSIPHSSSIVIRSIISLLGHSGSISLASNMRNNLLSFRGRATRQDILNFFRSMSVDEKIGELSVLATEMAGLEGTIFLDEKIGVETFVEAKSGYNFTMILPIGPYPNEKKWERQWCKCMVIDGVVERVAEVDGILQEAAQDGTPLAIFARGFSNEVLNTLKVNFDRKTLDILPIAFGVDNIETINTVADIIHVINIDPITPLKGDIIRGRSLAELPTVEMIRCHGENVAIVNGGVEHSVKSHVAELRKRRQAAHSDIATLLGKRIKSLAATSVTLKLGHTSNSIHQKQLEQIDVLIRVTTAIIKLGVIHKRNLRKLMGTTGDDVLLAVWEQIAEGDDIIPTAQLVGAYDSVNAFFKSVNNIGIGILEDRGNGRN